MVYRTAESLNKRKTVVQVCGVLSEPFDVPRGTPQGCVISSSCFIVAVNSIASAISNDVRASIYVDDLAIYLSGMSPRLFERKLQVVIRNLGKWCNKICLIFSPTKTVSMHICRKNCPKVAHNLGINGNNIACVYEYKYLEVTLDNALSWKNYIQILQVSCHKTLNLLKHLSHKDLVADRTSQLRLYVMLLKPKLDYVSEAYASASKSYL